MRRRVVVVVHVLALLLIRASGLAAQDARPDTVAGASITHFVRTTSGSTFVGRMLRERSDSIWIATSGGLLALPRDAVAELRSVSPPTSTQVNIGFRIPPRPGCSSRRPGGCFRRARDTTRTHTCS